MRFRSAHGLGLTRVKETGWHTLAGCCGVSQFQFCALHMYQALLCTTARVVPAAEVTVLQRPDNSASGNNIIHRGCYQNVLHHPFCCGCPLNAYLGVTIVTV